MDVPLMIAYGEVIHGLVSGAASDHSLALAASPPPRNLTTLEAVSNGISSEILSGSSIAVYGGYFLYSFDIGTTTAYGTTISSPSNYSYVYYASQLVYGLSPGTTYHYRFNVGSYNGQDMTFTTLSLLQNWRQMSFGTSANTGSAADAADFDGDGIPNLIEWACNLDPTTRSALATTTATNGANFEYTYSRSTSAANAGTTFTVEWSDTLASGSWKSSGVVQTVLSDDGTTQQVKAVIPINASSAKFVRLSVTAPP